MTDLTLLEMLVAAATPSKAHGGRLRLTSLSVGPKINALIDGGYLKPDGLTTAFVTEKGLIAVREFRLRGQLPHSHS